MPDDPQAVRETAQATRPAAIRLFLMREILARHDPPRIGDDPDDSPRQPAFDPVWAAE
jgi:hypothetical protein